MAKVLGVNAVFHDPAAALVVDGHIVAAAEEERFSRRKHGKIAVPFSTWEVPEAALAFCLEAGGIDASALDAVAYSYDPHLVPDSEGRADEPYHGLTNNGWEGLRTIYAEDAPNFLRAALPGLDPSKVCFVAHHLAHAASATLASPYEEADALVLDGRGEKGSYMSGVERNGAFEVLQTQDLPHSLGLFYEELTVHLGFQRSSDEYKVMALASYGKPTHLDLMREVVTVDDQGHFHINPVDFSALAPARRSGQELGPEHADLASSVQVRLEEAILDLARWTHKQTGSTSLAMAGGVALNCVANSRLWAEGPYDAIWVQPAAGDAGTALGAALWVARQLGDDPKPMTTAALGRGWTDGELKHTLDTAALAYRRPDDLAAYVARRLAQGAIVGWFEGRSEYGPRALGHRSLLADPRDKRNLERLNDVKGREQFRPVAPMVLEDRAAEIFEGPLPSPYMLFVHRARDEWAERIPAVVHVDGTARAQTVNRSAEPKVAALLDAFDRETGVPVLVNTSFNTAGRPMVDSPRDALEVFGSAPLQVLVMGPYVLERSQAGEIR